MGGQVRNPGCFAVVIIIGVILVIALVKMGIDKISSKKDEKREFEYKVMYDPSKEQDKIKTEKGVIEINGYGYIDGIDDMATPPLTVMKAKIWKTRKKNNICCILSHGEKIKIKRHYNNMFLIEKNSCKGWISELFISDKKRKPVGDMIY